MTQAVTTGRNDKCPCGSGRKFKQCCASKEHGTRGSKVMFAIVAAVIIGGIAAGVASFGESSSATAGPGKIWSPEHGHFH